MDRHLAIVANGFRALGFLLGVPALLALLWLTALRIDFARLKPDKSAPSASQAIDIGRDGIIGIIVAGGAAIGKTFEFLGNATVWVAGVLSVAAAALTLAGVCLFFTGRGLFLHATWARIVAGFAASGMLLISFLALTSLRRGAAFAPIPVGASIYALWVLIRRFS